MPEPVINTEKAEVERFYEDLQDLLELGDWNAKVGSQEIPGVAGKFGLGVQNEVGQRLTEFCQENALVKQVSQFYFPHIDQLSSSSSMGQRETGSATLIYLPPQRRKYKD